MKIKALVAAAALVAPNVASADAIAVALGASFQQVEVTTNIEGSFDGTVEIPALTVNGQTEEINLGIFGTYSLDVTGTTDPNQGAVSGEYSATVTTTSNELASISVAAAAGRNAVASSVANRHGSTGANSGASESSSAILTAEVDAGWTQYSSAVNVQD